METEKRICAVTFVLVIIGALNWGMVGFFQIDLVAKLFGAGHPISNIIYMLVGVSGLYLAFKAKAICNNMR